MSTHMKDDSKFWDELSGLVDGEPEAVNRHADLLADSDAHRDARHEASAAAQLVAEGGSDYEPPPDMEERVLSGLESADAEVAPAPGPQALEQAPESRHEVPAGAAAEGADAIESPATRPASSGKGGKLIVLFGGLAAAAVAVLVFGGLGLYAYFNHGEEVAGGGATGSAHALTANLARADRAADDGQLGVSARMASADEFSPVSEGAPLGAGAAIRTDSRTRAKLDLSDGTVLVLNHETEVILDNEAQRQVRLTAGELVADVAHLEEGPAASFHTPAGRVEVLGTKFVLTATESLTSVRVVRGTVRLHGKGESVKVSAGQEGLVQVGETPTVTSATHLARSVEWSEFTPNDPSEAAIQGLGDLRAKRPGEREARERPLTLAHHKSTIRIVGNVARTEIEETFQNDSGETLEGIYRFPLPPDAQIASLSLLVDDEWEEGAFVERDRAKRIWRGVIRNATPERQRERQEEFIWVPGNWRDPALLEWQRGGQFELRIFPIPARGSRQVRLAYTQTVAPHRGDQRRYVHPMAHSSDESTRVGRFEVDVRVANVQDGVTVHGYPLEAQPDGDAINFTYAADNFLPSGDLMIDFAPEGGDGEVRWWTFKGESTVPPPANTREGNEGVVREHRELHQDGRPYVVFALRPELPAWTEERRRDYIVIVDSSQSMVGERYDRASNLAESLIGEMDRRDRFTLLACDIECRRMGEQLETPSGQTASNARSWLRSVQPAGASNLARTLREAARIAGNSADRELRVVYIGDGAASIGPRRASFLASETEDLTRNAPHLSFTTVGIGGDADTMSLSAIARAGGGHYVPYLPGQRRGSAALAVLETTYGVSLAGASIELPAGIVDVAPAKLPTIRAGQEVLVVGRMSGDTVSGEMRLTGKVGGRAYAQRYPVNLTASTARGNAFVPRLWASGTLDKLDLGGRGEDRDRMVALSKSFGVLSRHTSLLVLESEAMFRAFGVDRGQQAVQWTGEEDAEMGESAGLDRHASGSGLGGLSGIGDALRSRGGGFGVGGMAGRGAGGEGSVRGSRSMAKRAPAPRREAAPAAEASADEAPSTSRSRRPPEPAVVAPRNVPGRWQRRVWFREATITPASDIPSAWTRRADAAEQALRENPDSRDRHRDLVRALSRAGNLMKARETVDAWIERDRLDPEALTYLSDVLGRQGKREQAMRVLSGVVDLSPEARPLFERLANAYERADMNDQACDYRVALADIRTDDVDTQATAVRCQRDLNQRERADRLMASQRDDNARRRVETAVGNLARTTGGDMGRRIEFELDANWTGGQDLDLSLVTPQGTRLSWLGGRSTVRAADARSDSRERLGLRRASVGTYGIEISRGGAADGRTIRGEVRVKVLGTNRVIPFTLNSERTVIGRIQVRRNSRTEWVTGNQQGTVVINSTPGARVQIDGRNVGTTPLRTTLPVGRHRLVLRASNGKSRTMNINVRAGRPTRVNQDLR